jgi:integral membrane protein (TIGR01906 family)
VTGNVRWAFNEVRLYTYGFDKYGIAEATGIPDPELRRIAEELVAYFNDDTDLLEIAVSGRPLYNQREVLHMRDVKGLVKGVYMAQWAAGAVLLAYAAGGFALRGRGFLRRLLRTLRLGGALTIGGLAVAGVALAVAFRWLFYLFHIISFRNPLWQLDPRTDYLLKMFPEGFWFDATMFIALATAAEALLVALGSWLALRLMRARAQARR